MPSTTQPANESCRDSTNAWLRWASLLVLVGYWGALAIVTHVPSWNPDSTGEGGNDKLAHFVAYGGLAFLIAWAGWVHYGAIRAVITLLTVGVYGVVDEWLQGFVPTRVPDVWDFAADMAGGAVGLAAATLLAHLWLRRRERLSAAQQRAGPPTEIST